MAVQLPTPPYRSDAELRAVVEAFETRTLPLEAFNHARHITVALWYLHHQPYPEALKTVRDGLKAFIGHFGADGYHETLTVFWVRLLAHHLAGATSELPLYRRANHAIAMFCGSISFRHYSRELIATDVAKRAYQEPDLEPLPF
jgi:hypothetical protein